MAANTFSTAIVDTVEDSDSRLPKRCRTAQTPPVFTLVSLTGDEFEVPVDDLRGSGLYREMLETFGYDASAESIDANVSTAVLIKLVKFLANSRVNPIIQIARPLKSRRLQDSGVPEWAVEFIRSIPLGPFLLDVMEGAQLFRMGILFQLGCARIASEVMYVGATKLERLAGPRAQVLTVADKQKLRSQNSYFLDGSIAISCGVIKNDLIESE